MSDFRQLSESVWASPQVESPDIAGAKAQGFTMIINNRPDGESADQPSANSIEAQSLAEGMAYRAIPISHTGFSNAQVDAMEQALADAEGPVLAYCRSGTRSTLLWSLVQAKLGMQPDQIAAAAASAGYDIAPIRPAIDAYAAQASQKT